MLSESITIIDYKDSDWFQKLKTHIWNCASNDEEINLSKLQPHEYKYFSELYFLYNDLHHKRIEQEEAKKRDKENYKEYVDYSNAQVDYFHVMSIINDNIRKAGTLTSEIEKTEDIGKIALLACDVIGLMTNDKGFLNRQKRKFGVK